jgi:hypothetical protein
VIINQRGGSIDIDNTTDQEKIKISHRSGSNINLANPVSSELATNNKQINVINDSYHTVNKDSMIHVGGDQSERVCGNTSSLRGFSSSSEFEAIKEWKRRYNEYITLNNSQFKICRGGYSIPNGTNTPLTGNRDKNPVLKNEPMAVENSFSGYIGRSIRTKNSDDVTLYAKVPDRGNTQPASPKTLTVPMIEKSAGARGSNAPGVLEFGADKSAATEEGSWSVNIPPSFDNLVKKLEDLQNSRINNVFFTEVERDIADGGDTIDFVKRNKYQQIGAVFNDYPSIKIDEKGRSQPFEMLVSDIGIYKNHDYVPHIEEIDNFSNYPCGNFDRIIANRWTTNVGSGGIHFKTTGATELGGATLKAGYKKININASHGLQIASEAFVEIQSLKTITLRTNRQVYIESALGIRGNTIIGGGLNIEGEVYLHHITAPLEVHQTEDTTVFGKFATDTSKSLPIGEVYIWGEWVTVYALPDDDIIVTYPHSHHHNGIPMRLTKANKDVRKFAQNENINKHDNISQALAQNHERKIAQVALD